MTIKAGDLVWVAHAHCGMAEAAYGGSIEKVLSVEGGGALVCGHCGELHATNCAAELQPGQYLPVQWLRRIPPLSDLTGIDETLREKVPA